MFPLSNLDIGGSCLQILRNRGIHFCEMVCQYTKAELKEYGMNDKMIAILNDELKAVGFDGPLIRKKGKTRNRVDWDRVLTMPEGVKLFGGTYRGECLKEDDEQIHSFRWWTTLNRDKKGLFMHINNETISNVQGYVKSISKGMLPRAPDNLILFPANGYSGFACELKKKDVKQSLSSADRRKHFEEQKQILSLWSKQGFYACVACGAEEFMNAWNEYIIASDID